MVDDARQMHLRAVHIGIDREERQHLVADHERILRLVDVDRHRIGVEERADRGASDVGRRADRIFLHCVVGEAVEP